MKTKTLRSAILFVFGLILLACSSTNEKKERIKISAINPPLKGVEVPSDKFNFDASKDQSIRTKEGTVISIPANSLVDKNGKIIEGNVELKFKSIHTPGEIIASGIPMVYDSSGVKYDFISAGMFEISARQKGEEIFIAENKQINVDFASYKDGEDFSFYKIDTKTGKWSYKGISKPKINKVKKEKLKKFEDDNLFEFDLSANSNPDLKLYHKQKWFCIDEDSKNPSKNKWIRDENWYEINIEPLEIEKNTFQIYLSNGLKSVEFVAYPYNMNEEAAATFKSNVKILNEKLKKAKEEEAKIQFEADITRNYSISSFGTYNWDKIDREIEAGNLAVVNAAFQVNSKEIDKEMSVFHFSGKNKLLSRITQKWEKMVFDPKGLNVILIILADNFVAVCNSDEFRKIGGNKNFMFNLKKRAQKIKSVSEIDALLNTMD